MYRALNAVWGTTTIRLIGLGLLVALLFVGCGGIGTGDPVVDDDTISVPHYYTVGVANDYEDNEESRAIEYADEPTNRSTTPQSTEQFEYPRESNQTGDDGIDIPQEEYTEPNDPDNSSPDDARALYDEVEGEALYEHTYNDQVSEAANSQALTYLRVLETQLFPPDNLEMDDDFAEMYERFVAAVYNRDISAFEGFVYENILFDFGWDTGREYFFERWNLYSDPEESQIWDELKVIIELGGFFPESWGWDYADGSVFIAPYP